VGLRFRPVDTTFYDLFTESAQHLVVGAGLLAEMLSESAIHEDVARRMREAEHQADETTHAIVRRVNTTFVTPFDREDIHALISRLDDILDLIEEVADTCILYNIDAPTPPAMEQAAIIVRQCEQLSQGLGKLRHFKGVEPFWIEIHRLENEGDRIARQAVAELFKHGQDPMDVIKWKDVYALLEKAIDSAEDAANVIERIVVKHA
jgi:uncharacterized protein